MYRQATAEGLGFSLKLPSWASNLVQDVVQDVRLTVNTPAGPVSVTPAQALAYAKGAKLSVARPGALPGPIQQVANAVQGIPGGWLTVGAAALALVFLLKRK